MQIERQPLQTILLCPHCGDEYLHHEEVDVFNRGEDAALGQHTHVPATPNGTVVVQQDLAGNPSLRRHGIRIEHWCEGCHGRFSLCLVQHKGGTFLHWERSLEPLPGDPSRRTWAPFQDR